MKNLFFWAQSLDNQSPDIILNNTQEILDDTKRQQVVSEIYDIPGKKVDSLTPNSGVKFRFSDPKFLIEAIPAEKDQLDRLAPILIYGELAEELSQDWIESICSEISEVVSNKLNRTLSINTIEAIREWFIEVLEKKKKVEVGKYSLSLVIVFLLPLIVGWILQSNKIQPTVLQLAGLITLNNFLVISQTFVIHRFYRKVRI
jgi:hypothetical protein